MWKRERERGGGGDGGRRGEGARELFAVIDFGCCVASLEKCQIRDCVPPIFAVF